MRKRIYENGQKFSFLKIIDAYKVRDRNRWMHMVVCDCGNKKLADGSDLKQGKTKSCGCKRYRKKHGMCGTSEYKSWASMIQRCTNKNNSAFGNYGGRGIKVSDSWLTFKSFIDDMGFKPSKDLTLERVNNEKGYSKDNCVWANRFEQSQNRRIRVDNKTGFTGVSVNGNKFTATYQVNKNRLFLGNYKTAEEANVAIQNHIKAINYE